MKDNLKETIKKNAYRPGENPIFTKRVLYRLPERQKGIRWIIPAAFVMSIAILVAYGLKILNGECDTHRCMMTVVPVALMAYGVLYSMLRPMLRSFFR